MNRHLGMICQDCKEVLSVRDGTGMEAPDPTVLTDAEREKCMRFLLEHVSHQGAALCLFDVTGIGSA